MTFRILTIVGVMTLALGLVGITLTLAQDEAPAPGTLTEAEREAAASAEMEANPPLIARASSVFTPPAVISAPLFVGVDEPAQFTYLVDPATSANYPLFDGFDVWGAAFDPDERRIFLSLGSSMAVWPLDAAPGTLGLIRSSATAQPLAMVGLAYHDGTLYGSRISNTADDPEGIYIIDPVTLSATINITYDVPLGQVDIGGLAADPATGDLYGTNDAAALRGLVKIGPDGSLTVVAPYPAGQNDIDGLAIGDGRAYLITDQPGDFSVFDLATLTYTTSITNPWATSELFAGATWITAPAVVTPSITLTKTVGLDPNDCAETAAMTLTETMDVTYCYTVRNTGGVTLTQHTLEDSALGNLLTDSPYELGPGASFALTQTASITQTTVNSATWTAYNLGPTDMVTATAAATVTMTVPIPDASITLTKTVGLDPEVCAETTSLDLTEAGDVTYCYTVRNTGGVTLTQHTLDDSALGNLLLDSPYDLGPGASFSLTRTASITQTTVNTATWTAYNLGPTDTVTATAAATVTVPAVETEPDINVAPASLSADLIPTGQITAGVTISNDGDADLTWTAYFAPFECDAPGALLWASAGPTGGTTAPGATSDLTVTFTAAGSPLGELMGVLCVASNDPDEPVVTVPLTLTLHEIRSLLPIIYKP
ncbi:MAG: hypothetical protein KA170_00420 [Candidatus Promineofilum sp.]|nr:hypothetical protein [Promineifilum sp.]